MYKNRKISLVIPAYNEQRLIGPTLDGVPPEIDCIYVVDDCSKDKMVDIVRDRMESDKRIRLLRHSKNRGVGAAIITGYLESSKEGYDIAVVVGGDNQMDLKDLHPFLDAVIEKKMDYAKGNRFLYAKGIPPEMPLKRLIGNSLLSLMTKLASGYYHIYDTMDGYTAISKEAIDRVNWDYAWKGYGYPADFLILFNAYRLRVLDIPRRAIYLKGERQTQIKIVKYMVKVVPLIFLKFFWRLWKKYITGDFHPFVLFYFMSFFLLPIGIGIGLWFSVSRLVFNIEPSVNWLTLAVLLIVIGLQTGIFAMLFDSEQNRQLMQQN